MYPHQRLTGSVILGVAVLWFGYFSARVLIAYIPQLWGGG